MVSKNEVIGIDESIQNLSRSIPLFILSSGIKVLIFSNHFHIHFCEIRRRIKTSNIVGKTTIGEPLNLVYHVET